MKAHAIKTQATATQDEKVGAYLNAKFTNEVNKQNFTTAEVAKVYSMKFALELVYNSEAIRENYRKTKATVKVCAPYTVKDKKGLKALEDAWEQQGITKVVSAQGIIYSVK